MPATGYNLRDTVPRLIYTVLSVKETYTLYCVCGLVFRFFLKNIERAYEKEIFQM